MSSGKVYAQEKSEESGERVDPAQTLKEKCAKEPHCHHLQEKLNECTQRVNSKPNTTENCEEELFDFLGCVDHCAAPQLFKYLK